MSDKIEDVAKVNVNYEGFEMKVRNYENLGQSE